MKKKIGIIVGILFIVVLVVIKVFLNFKTDGEDIENIELKTTSYITSLTNGYATAYNGVELLYDKKTTIDDLTNDNILNTAIRYAVDNLDVEVNEVIINNLESKGYTIDKFTFYNAKAIREAIKELFGLEWDNKSSSGDMNFVYRFIYLEEYDVYLKTTTEYMNDYYNQNTSTIEYKITDTKKSKNNIKITVAIAYVDVSFGELVYYSDKTGDNEVYKDKIDASSIDDSKLNSFKKYIITLKNVDGKYVFDSIEEA